MDTDDERIEDVKKIVEFMPDDKMQWEDDISRVVLNNEIADHCFFTVGAVRPERLRRDRNLHAEVLDEIEERGLWWTYIFTFTEVAGDKIRNFEQERSGEKSSVLYMWWKIHTADPEDIFEVIVSTLEGEVE